MGWSGGTYTKGNAGSGGWVGDASLGIAIEASRHDTQDNDFATGINNCLTKDGQNTPTANLGMGGYKHTGVGNATAADEYLSYGQLLNANKAVTTSGTAPNFTVTLTPAPTAYVTGQIFAIRIHTNLLTTGGATLNVNGLGAKDLKIGGSGNATRTTNPYELSQRQVYYVVYDGTDDLFRILNPTPASYVPFTPTLGTASGTIFGTANGYYFIMGDAVFVSYDINFGISGSTTNYISATLPFNRYNDWIYLPFTTYMSSVSGQQSYSAVSSLTNVNNVLFFRSDGVTNFPIDANMFLRSTGIYKGVVS
jgi:hypothetical protein